MAGKLGDAEVLRLQPDTVTLFRVPLLLRLPCSPGVVQ